MGMAISVDIPGCGNEQVFKDVFKRLNDIDKRFSPYKKESELSRFQKKQLSQKELSKEFKQVIGACKEAEKQTGGYFSAYFSGRFDPTGYVKGWAIAQAEGVIESKGFKTYCIGAGGDILARSTSEKIWNIGIQDPEDNNKILKLLSIKNGAVATSGKYERGEHIINPKTKKPATGYISLSVIGPDIITADILATAAFAAGNLKLIENEPAYKAVALPA
jgi:thiamine biosynthesis lipoprotein